MRNTRIYFSGELPVGSTVLLDKTASHHLIRVLRMKAGANITLFNNSFYEYDCELLDTNQKAVSVRIDSATECKTESSIHIHLLQGISRSDRMDLSIQKTTELGVSRITPVICERTNTSLSSERALKKLDHWNQIIISACEQCGRSKLTQLDDIETFENAIKQSRSTSRLILDPNAETGCSTLQASSDITLLIGPEGGLTETEIKLARENQFIGLRLGPRVLRTETAAIVGISALQVLWGDMG